MVPEPALATVNHTVPPLAALCHPNRKQRISSYIGQRPHVRWHGWDQRATADTETLQVREKQAKIPGALLEPREEIKAKAFTLEEASLGAVWGLQG